MKSNLLSFNISNYKAQLIHELKYQVHRNPEKYSVQTAQAVEGIFIQILLKNMKSSSSQDGLFDNHQSRLYTDVYNQELSQILSKKGIGLAKVILKQLEIKNDLDNQKII